MTEPTSADDLQPATRKDVRDLTAAVTHLAATNRWRKIGYVAMAGFLAAVMALSISNVVLFHRTASDSACVRNWAVQTTVRTNALVPLSTARNDALDTLVRSLATKDPTERQSAFSAAFSAYLAASDDYRNAVKDNPPPAAPAFNC